MSFNFFNVDWFTWLCGDKNLFDHLYKCLKVVNFF